MRRALVLMLGVFIAACSDPSSTEVQLRRVSEATSDPEALKLEPGYNTYVRRAHVEEGIEVGVIKFKDGSSSKFWFMSHHLTDDYGGTSFKLSDGTELYMTGGFCCEVQLPDDQLSSLGELRAFVRKHNGESP